MPRLIQHLLDGPFWAWFDPVGDAIAMGGFWDVHLRDYFDQGDPAGWAIDLGANTGFLTTYLARRYAHVLAVEAHPTTFALLCKTLGLQDLFDSVTPVWAAAWDATCMVRLCTEGEAGWALPSPTDLDQAGCASAVAFRPATEKEGFQVPALAVDQLIPPTVKVSLIKVDVQNADLKAIRGLAQTIERDRPIVLFEYEINSESWHGDALTDYFDWFAQRNYQVTQIVPHLQDYVAVPQ